MTTLPVPELPQARCPRCGGGFHCGARDPGPCACTGLHLRPDLLLAMRTLWSGCLCLPCLQALAAGAALTVDTTAQTTQGD
ncbi:MAG: cysteine-rich CWC family protein [Burkholderiales bacterium]|nr:cysteine-rich CWC family protein [Burkholderiales bacterium]